MARTELVGPYQFDQQCITGGVFEEDTLFTGVSQKRRRSRLPFIVAGVDEAGRGPLAGPLVAAAVILPAFPRISGLSDSKTLAETEREELFPKIKKTALSVSISIVEPALIDQWNILKATMSAMREAIVGLKIRPDLVIVDGNQRPQSGVTELTVVKGDAKSAAVMAASIVAKVTRDRLMKDLDKLYPHYGFRFHKGYGVPMHLEALQKHGPSPCHRKSFEPVKSLINKELVSLF